MMVVDKGKETMTMLLSDLAQKELIQAQDGIRYGLLGY